MGLLYIFYLLPIRIYFLNVNIPCNIYNLKFRWDVHSRLSISIFIYLFIYLFIHLFIHLFIYLFIYSFIYLFSYSFIYLFI